MVFAFVFLALLEMVASLSLFPLSWPSDTQKGGKFVCCFSFLFSILLQEIALHLLHINSCLGGFAKTMYNMVVLLSCFA